MAHISARLDYLKTSRPTAVDLGNAVASLKAVCLRAHQEAVWEEKPPAQDIINSIRDAYIDAAEDIWHKDLQTNQAIGAHGAAWLRAQMESSKSDAAVAKISVLTHCNTGSLATSGYGTALGIVRSLYTDGVLARAFCTETRPYNQGSRLTAFELVHEGIPATLVTDSMTAALMGGQRRSDAGVDDEKIFAVIVGADRVVRNGDTANKIGTYALAVLSRYHGVRFVVAAPTTSIDLETASGRDIRIEQRAREELTQVSGPIVDPKDGSIRVGETVRVATADQRIDVWNPAFDVTPHELIDCIVTELGPVVKGGDGRFDFSTLMPERWTQAQAKDG